MPNLRILLPTVALGVIAAVVVRAAPPQDAVTSDAALSGEVFSVDQLTLEMGPGRLHINSGRLYAAAPVQGASREFVLVGDARFRLDPPDDIERGQLEFFIDEARLDEEILSAVLVINSDAALTAITARQRVEPQIAERSLARSTYSSWRRSPEREVTGVEAALLRDAHADPAYDQYFCAWLFSRARGRFVYLVDPEAYEQVTLGRFERVELSERDRRRLKRQLHREQRQGRLIGADVRHLGQFDTWASTHMSASEAGLRRGLSTLDVSHYDLELDVQRDARHVRGRAAISLQSRVPTTVLRLGLHSDLVVESVAARGVELDFATPTGELLAFLPQRLDPGRSLEVVITYAGPMIDRQGSTAMLKHTLDWYPNTGTDDLATFDVLFRWPARFDLLSSGEVVEVGEEGDQHWRRAVLRRPSSAFGFEVGKFRREVFEVRGIQVTFATDYQGRLLTGSRSRETLIEAIRSALDFCIDTFGEYPFEQLTLVTTSRDFSQSLPGFITLSSLMLADDTWLALYSGLEDPRGLIAHEIAHQWWGHRVTFAGYREAWLSEGMANYAATLYVRKNVSNLRFGRGPTTGWRLALTERLEDGTTLEQIGPLTLGKRLNSSRASAYEPIVYRKGALVLGMMARAVGEDRFLQALRILVDFVDERDAAITTSDFVALLSQITQRQLYGFAEQFIFATGLPSINYQYRIVSREDGGWRVQGEIARQSSLAFAYGVEEVAPGILDVERQIKADIESHSATLYLPFRIVLEDEVLDDKIRYRFGLLTLNSEDMEFAFDLDQKPATFELDPYDEVFALSRNLSLYPKRRRLIRGLEQLASGDRDAARDSFLQVLSAAAYDGDVPISARWIEDERNAYNARAHRELCRLALQEGDVETAADQLARAAQDVSFRVRKGLKYKVLEARIALRRGDPEEALKHLEKEVYRSGSGHIEANLVFVVAAIQAGRSQEARTVLARLHEKPVDISWLSERIAG